MFATTHVLASIVISQHTPTPWWAFFISLLSHYFLDLIPHGDRPIDSWLKRGSYFKKAMIVFLSDAALLVIFFITAYQKMMLPRPAIVTAAIVGGILPDALWILYDMYKRYLERHGIFRLFLSRIEPLLNHHKKIHNYIDHSPINHKISPIGLGIAAQILFLGIFIALALYPSFP